MSLGKVWRFWQPLVLGLFAQLLCTATSAQNLQIDIMDLAPYGYLDERGNTTGIFVEIANRIGSEAGFVTRHHLLVVPRILQQMESGRTHCSVFIQPAQPSNRFDNLANIPWNIDIIALASPGIALRTVADLKPLRVAIPRGMIFGNGLDDEAAFIRHHTNDYQQSVRMLQRGRVDAIVGTAPSLYYFMRLEGVTADARPLLIDTRPLCLLCVKNLSATQKKRLQQATEKLSQNGALADIIARHTGTAPQP